MNEAMHIVLNRIAICFSAFGLTETALENLYMIWLPKVPEGDDTSFPAFVKWMKEQNKDEPEAVGKLPCTRQQAYNTNLGSNLRKCLTQAMNQHKIDRHLR